MNEQKFVLLKIRNLKIRTTTFATLCSWGKQRVFEKKKWNEFHMKIATSNQ